MMNRIRWLASYVYDDPNRPYCKCVADLFRQCQKYLVGLESRYLAGLGLTLEEVTEFADFMEDLYHEHGHKFDGLVECARNLADLMVNA